MPPFRVYLLGHFRLRLHGEPVAFGRKTPRRLLQLLQAIAVLGPREASRTRIVEALWPDADGDAGHDAFEIALHRLRKLLGDPAAVTVSHGHVGLDTARVWIDTEAFEAAATAIEQRHVRARTDPSGFVADLEQALGLYAGPLLAHEDDQPWLLPERDRLERRFVRLAHDSARSLMEAGCLEAAIDVLRRGLDVEPLAEELHRRLISAYAAAGRRAEAAQAYRHCAKLLHDVLGVTPSAETERALGGAATTRSG